MIKFSRPNIELNEEEIKHTREILSSSQVCMGPQVSALEELFENRFQVKHAIACASATTGLTIAVKAAGWHNRRVGVPSFTWPSTAYAVDCSPNEVHLCDVDKNTWLMTIDLKDLDAIIPVDTFGSEYETIVPFNKQNVIIDAAHGFDLPNLGHRGLAEVISLSFTKLVTGMQGGVILTNDDEFASRAQELVKLAGKMTEINAFIAIRSIDRHDRETRKTNARLINQYRLGIDVKFDEQLINTAYNGSVYAILFENSAIRNAVYSELLNNGVETKIYYHPLKEGFKNTDYIYGRILALPIYQEMECEQERIIDLINRTVKSESIHRR